MNIPTTDSDTDGLPASWKGGISATSTKVPSQGRAGSAMQ